MPRIATRPLAVSAAWESRFRRRPGATTAPQAARGRGTTGSHVPHRSPDHARATSMPDTAWPVDRHPPGSSRGAKGDPGFDATCLFSTRQQWFACARLRDPHLPRSTARRLPRRSPPRLLTAAARGWFAASACTAAAEGHQTNRPSSSISCTALSPVVWSSTSSLLQRSCSHLRPQSRRVRADVFRFRKGRPAASRRASVWLSQIARTSSDQGGRLGAWSSLIARAGAGTIWSVGRTEADGPPIRQGGKLLVRWGIEVRNGSGGSAAAAGGETRRPAT